MNEGEYKENLSDLIVIENDCLDAYVLDYIYNYSNITSLDIGDYIVEYNQDPYGRAKVYRVEKINKKSVIGRPVFLDPETPGWVVNRHHTKKIDGLMFRELSTYQVVATKPNQRTHTYVCQGCKELFHQTYRERRKTAVCEKCR